MTVSEKTATSTLQISIIILITIKVFDVPNGQPVSWSNTVHWINSQVKQMHAPLSTYTTH